MEGLGSLRPYNGNYRPPTGKYSIVGRGVFDGEYFLIVDHLIPSHPVEVFDNYNEATEETAVLRAAQVLLEGLSPLFSTEFYILDEDGSVSSVRS